MARKRMIDPTIWEDENFGRLSPKAKILFIGLFSNADDEGRIRTNPAYLRSTIFIYDDMGVAEINKLLDEVCLIMKHFQKYSVENNTYGYFDNWKDFQKQREERIAPSVLPSPLDGQMSDNCQTNVSEMSAEIKLSKDKLSKDSEKIVAASSSVSWLTSIPLEDMGELQVTYQAAVGQIKSKAEELANYCKAHGKTYKDYKAFLMNALNRDFGKRKTPIQPKTEMVYNPETRTYKAVISSPNIIRETD